MTILKFFRVMPPGWRPQIEMRLQRRVDPENIDLRATEILRRALGLIQIAAGENVSPPVRDANEREAIVAVRVLLTWIINRKLSVNDIAIVKSNAKHASRRAA
jgi:hypothetical protein